MSIDIGELISAMLKAAKDVASDKLPEIKEYVETETKKFAESLLMIVNLRKDNKITEEQAKLHLDIQKNAARAVLLCIEGMGILAAEEAINSVLAVVKDVVNGAIGFELI